MTERKGETKSRKRQTGKRVGIIKRRINYVREEKEAEDLLGKE
jgi:hypothetical protein